MQKKLLSNMALLIAVNLLIKPFWILFVDLSVQNKVGYEAYGDYVSMFNIALILTMLLDFGINNFNSSTIAQNPKIVSRQFSELFSLKLVLSAIYLLLTILLAYFYGFNGNALFFVLMLSLCQVVAHFSTFARSSISGLQYFKTDSLLSAFDRLVMIVLGMLMLYGIGFQVNIANFIYIQLAGYVAVFVVAVIILRKHLDSFRISFRPALLRDMFYKTYPYALLAFIMLLYTRMDVLLMKKLVTDGDMQNGIYARAWRLLEASTLMIGATSAIMLPVFARMLAGNERMESITRTLVAVVLIPVATFSVWCSVYNTDVMRLLSPDASDEVCEAFSFLILAFIPYTCMYIFGSMLTAKAEMKALIGVATSGLIINITLNIALLPYLGAKGAAIAALTTQSVVGFGKAFFAINRIGIRLPTGFYTAIVVLIALITVAIGLMHFMKIHFMAAAFVALVIAVPGMFNRHLLSLDTLRQIIAQLKSPR